MVCTLLSSARMLPSRWSHLARYGLLGSTLLAAGARPAAADPCDDHADRTIAFVLGLQVAPEVRVVGGVEARACINDKTEAMLRFELGAGSPRLIGGARVRPFESPDRDDDLELVGVEAGGILDMRGKLGLHLAATYGTHSAYAALQTHVTVSEPDPPTRWSLLAGFAPWTAFGPTVVEGRPIASAGQLRRPPLARRLAALHSAEARAARSHFVGSAQLELSSVWTFMRLAAELAAVGAPAELIARALDAADDEVHHAMLCARAAGGIALAALPAALARPRFRARSATALATLAIEAWCEGCLNETAAAAEARFAAEAAASDEIRTMLARIAHDETRHAELSWAVLAWLFTTAPEVTRAALAAVPHEALPALPSVDRALARYGVPTEAMTAAARSHARRVADARLVELAA